jgi:hypothetical protein
LKLDFDEAIRLGWQDQIGRTKFRRATEPVNVLALLSWEAATEQLTCRITLRHWESQVK